MGIDRARDHVVGSCLCCHVDEGAGQHEQAGCWGSLGYRYGKRAVHPTRSGDWSGVFAKRTLSSKSHRKRRTAYTASFQQRWDFLSAVGIRNAERRHIKNEHTIRRKNGVGSIPTAYLLVGLGMVTVRELEVDLGQCGRRNRFRQSPAQAGTVGIGRLHCSRGNVPKGQRG